MKHLFIRDGLHRDDTFNIVEDYLRNVRAPNGPNETYTDEQWETPIKYRMPYRTGNNWKLVRDLETKDDMYIIHRDADQYNWREGEHPAKQLSIKDLIHAADESYCGAAFLAVWPIKETMTDDETLSNLHLCTKDNDGILVDFYTKELLYTNENNQLVDLFATLFKMGNLPIYTLFLNSSQIINKCWWTNEPDNGLAIYAENEDIYESIFHPIFTDNVVSVGESILYVKEKTFTIDMYGTKHWEGKTGKQQAGSEIVLSGLTPPPIGNSLKIDTNLEFAYDGKRYIQFALLKPSGYIKLAIDGGSFFDDFGGEIKFEYLVQGGK